jgi:hypothetical protein
MKLIDEKGRLFGFVNVFDFIVLIIVVILISGIGYKIVKDRNEKDLDTSKTYIVTVKCQAVPDTFDDALKKDDRIFYDNDGFTNARITSIKEVPAVVTVQTSDGKLVETQDPSLKDVYVELEVKDKPDQPDIRIGRYAVAVGSKISVKTIYAMAADSIVLDIKEK